MSAVHLQVPKEDEEDQWISGEELRTEGSSDEDCFDNQTARKKHKTNVLLKRLLVSSLALPTALEPEETVSDSRILPSISHTDKLVKPNTDSEDTSHIRNLRQELGKQPDVMPVASTSSHVKINISPVGRDSFSEMSADLSEQYDCVMESRKSVENTKEIKFVRFEARCTDDETDETSIVASKSKPKSLQDSLRKSLEVEQSRPYRYEKGETKTTNHLIFEMNEFYFEMADQLRFLRSDQQFRTGVYANDDEMSISSDWSYKTKDLKVLSLMSQIGKDEVKFVDNIRMLQAEKQERQAILDEICTIDKKAKDAQNESQTLLNASCLKDAEPVAKEKISCGKDNEHPPNALGKSKQQQTKRNDKDFVAKNIELAKEYTMSRCCLTDEEKIKLEELLSDIDVPDEHIENAEFTNVEEEERRRKVHVSDEQAIQVIEDQSEQEEGEGDEGEVPEADSTVSGFKLELNDERILAKLESKLRVVSENIPNDGVSVEKIIDDLKAAEEQGKHWKVPLLQKRLQNIDKYLNAIQIARNSENEELKKVEMLGESRDDQEEDYRKCLSEVHLEDFEQEMSDNLEDDGREEEEDNYEKCLSQVSVTIEDLEHEFQDGKRDIRDNSSVS